MAKETAKTKEKEQTGAGTVDDPVRVAVVDAPADGSVTTAGPAMTPEQRAGLEPMDRVFDNEQAEDREHLTNMQTDFEAENALDPVSGGPTPGVTSNAPLTAKAAGAPVSDMNGRLALSTSDEQHVSTVRQALKDATTNDRKAGKLKEDRIGWRTPQEIGIPGAIMSRIHDSGQYPIEQETVPNGHFFPETGKRYRLASRKAKSE